jgi:hypothetical protein
MSEYMKSAAELVGCIFAAYVFLKGMLSVWCDMAIWALRRMNDTEQEKSTEEQTGLPPDK